MYYVRHSSPLLSPMLSVRWMAQAERIPRLCASSASHGTTVLRRITSSTRSQRRREKKSINYTVLYTASGQRLGSKERNTAGRAREGRTIIVIAPTRGRPRAQRHAPVPFPLRTGHRAE